MVLRFLSLSLRNAAGTIQIKSWIAAPPASPRNDESGSAILFLFIAVALLGALSYAFLQGSRGSTGMIQSEAAKAASYQGQDCGNSVTLAAKRLQMRGCPTISYNPDGTGTDPDGSCSIFHPKGGGAKICAGFTMPPCTATTIGATCPDGTIYAGLSPDGNRRMYTTLGDAGSFPFNNGNTSGFVQTGAGSWTAGESNTEILAATDSDSATSGFQPHQAATYCYNLVSNGHDDWYLPSHDELRSLCLNNGAIGNFSTIPDYFASAYKSSSDLSATAPDDASVIFFYLSCNGGGATSVPTSHKVRCVRRD